MKYRIVEQQYKSGRTEFIPQFHCWFFWCSFADHYGYGQQKFDTYREAEVYINQDKKSLENTKVAKENIYNP